MKTDELYEIVVQILSEHESACNDDKDLIFRVLKHLGFCQDDALIIKKEKIGELPSFESIRRIRQKIQNEEGRFLPTYGNVLVRRGFSETMVRAAFGEDSKILQNYLFIKTEGARSRQAHVVSSL